MSAKYHILCFTQRTIAQSLWNKLQCWNFWDPGRHK